MRKKKGVGDFYLRPLLDYMLISAIKVYEIKNYMEPYLAMPATAESSL
jgi:hypothetical protein